MEKNRWQAVFLDIDGTLFSHASVSVPPSALQAVRKAREQGVLVFAATGRHRLEMEDMPLQDVRLDGWITVNGAVCYNDEGIFHAEPVPREDMRILYSRLQNDPFPVIFFEKDRMYMNIHDEEVRRQQAEIHTGLPDCEDISRILTHDIYQYVPWAKPEIWDPVEAQMKHIRSTRWTDLALDVMSDKAGKAAGIQAACRTFGIDPACTIGIGDGPNDIELLRACGLGIAMGNACDQLKETAAGVTGDIDADGLLQAFIQYGVI